MIVLVSTTLSTMRTVYFAPLETTPCKWKQITSWRGGLGEGKSYTYQHRRSQQLISFYKSLPIPSYREAATCTENMIFWGISTICHTLHYRTLEYQIQWLRITPKSSTRHKILTTFTLSASGEVPYTSTGIPVTGSNETNRWFCHGGSVR